MRRPGAPEPRDVEVDDRRRPDRRRTWAAAASTGGAAAAIATAPSRSPAARTAIAAAALAARRVPELDAPSTTSSTSSDASANRPNGWAATSSSADTAYGTTQRARRVRTSTSSSHMLPKAAAIMAVYPRANWPRWIMIGGDGRDQHRRPPRRRRGPAARARSRSQRRPRGSRTAPTAAAGPGCRARQHERGVHGQVVQRRPVPVVDGDVQHVARRRARGDRQRHALVVVQRPEVEPEPDHRDGVGDGRDTAASGAQRAVRKARIGRHYEPRARPGGAHGAGHRSARTRYAFGHGHRTRAAAGREPAACPRGDVVVPC